MLDSQNMTTLSISKGDREKLSALAMELGLKWGKRGNATRLVEMIARRELGVATQSRWNEERLRSLVGAYHLLVDNGKVDEALELRSLLLDRPELGQLQRLKLQKQEPARTGVLLDQIKELHAYKQPYRLHYQEKSGREIALQVQFGTIVTHERHRYLDCRVQELGEYDIPELRHNRSLRIDHILKVELNEEGEWRDDQDRVLVEMHLFEGLVDGYEGAPHTSEETQRIELAGETVLRVRRFVSNSFWFLREVLPYGERCEIVSPKSLREQFILRLQTLYSRYGKSPAG